MAVITITIRIESDGATISLDGVSTSPRALPLQTSERPLRQTRLAPSFDQRGGEGPPTDN